MALLIPKIILYTFLICLVLFYFNYFYWASSRGGKDSATYFASSTKSDQNSCLGRYVYVHKLESRFNDDILQDCEGLIKWFDMCPYMDNSGLGPQVENNGKILLKKSWYSTNQFMLEVIFRNRMKQYDCLTNDSSLASLFYVPYYAGLDVGRYLWDYNASMRDSAAFDILNLLAKQPEWTQMWGRDHFFVAGRPACDFHRKTESDLDWGSKLMFLAESKNMTMLSIEATPWSNEIGIPYPTYFHPASYNEILQWQNKMRHQKRPYLFSFVGAPRPGMNESIRNEIIQQCLASKGICNFLDCSDQGKCDNPLEVMKVFQDSIFCLQPPGDSYTRRSIFDSILAGCIPVFFHPGSAYHQYTWHLPQNHSKYSIFIPQRKVKSGKININKTLLGVSSNQVLAMRDEIIRLIPNIVYADTRYNTNLEDAFMLAIRGLLKRVEKFRTLMKEGKNVSVDFAEEKIWDR